jgi:signal transduction histidine kinase
MGARDSAIVGLRKSGEEFPAEVAISKLHDGAGWMYTAVLRDVTEQKRIESEQRFLAEVGPVLATSLDYEETLSKIAELAVKDIADLCIVDLVEGDEDVQRLRVTSRDPSKAWICQLLTDIPLDRRRPHLMQSTLETRRPVLLQSPSAETIASLAQSEEHYQTLREAEIRSMVAVPLMVHGRLLGAMAFISSTPSRVYGAADVRLAEELAQRAALSIENARLYRTAQRATQARDEVLGVVAHDLRNPLGTILIQAALLRLDGPKADPQSRATEVIERAATRMKRLIEDLLDVTRMEAGRLPIDPATIPAREVVIESVQSQESLVTSASLELRLDVAPDLAEVWADRDRLLQLFENLIGNAVKFTEPGGRVTVGATPRDGEVLFWVADTGVGISAEDLPHLFDRFWQARKAGRQGAGLGLPIVKGIVEAHGGRIWVESTPGHGSTFFVTFPMARREQARPPEPPSHVQ